MRLSSAIGLLLLAVEHQTAHAFLPLQKDVVLTSPLSAIPPKDFTVGGPDPIKPPRGKKVSARAAYLDAMRKKRGLKKPDPNGILRTSRLNMDATDEQEDEVILLGAGITSLYAGMILQDLGIPYHIYEADAEHIGGRILTYVPTNCNRDNYEYIDYGAMRLPEIDTMQRVFDLISTLGVTLLPYYLGDPNGKDISYFNGQVFRDGASPDPSFAPFIEQSYLDQGSSALLGGIFDEWVTKFENDLDAAMEEIMAFDTLSTRQYIQQVKGYPTEVIDWLETMNTASGLFDRAFTESVFDYFDFDSADTWHCVDKGMQTVTDAMKDLLLQDGAVITNDRTVTKISPNSADGKVKVTFTSSGGGTSEVVASDVISTLPLGPLRAVDTSECNFPVIKNVAHRVLSYDASVKVCLVFQSRWWEENNLRVGGQDGNDQPSRTIVFPSYGIDGSGKGVMIGSYTWSQDARRIGAMTKDEQIDACMEDIKATYQDVLPDGFDLDAQLIRAECDAHNWENNSLYQGAFALFGPGQFYLYYDDAVKPEVDSRLHFGGEALDIHHAWIIGSLNSAWRCVDEILQRRNDTVRRAAFIDRWGTIDDSDLDIPGNET